MITKTHIIILAVVAILVIQAFSLYVFLGNPLICPCGYVKLFDASVRSSENSQHLLDWYSFSHVIYGFLLYFAGWVARKKFGWPLYVVFLLAVALSTGWELFENTHFALHRFQINTISFDYYGDSIVNSLMDTVCMMTGFWLAWILPVWAVIVIVIGLELLVGFITRDNLLLNIIMFTHPAKAILHWQAALSP